MADTKVEFKTSQPDSIEQKIFRQTTVLVQE